MSCLGSRPRAWSPGTGELSEGGGGPGDDVMVGGGIDTANPRDGVARGDCGSLGSWDCSEGVGDCIDSELGEVGEGVKGKAGGEKDMDRLESSSYSLRRSSSLHLFLAFFRWWLC